VIQPALVGTDHPLYRIRNKEVFVSLTTERHSHTYPLIMYGGGQGGREGASGLVGDIIRVAQHSRGVL